MENPQQQCLVCKRDLVLPYTTSCQHTFCYLCLKAKFEWAQVCPECGSVLPMDIYEDAKMPTTHSHSDPNGPVWLYQGRESGWWKYDPITNQQLEKDYQHQLATETPVSTTIKIMNKSYLVDFVTMTQTPTPSIFGGISRMIKRVVDPSSAKDLLIKGVAGLQIRTNPAQSPPAESIVLAENSTMPLF